MYANQHAFDSPDSFRMATGVDLRSSKAIVDLKDNVLAYAQTGGIISPMKYVLQPGTAIWRFLDSAKAASRAAEGAWWVDQPEFEKLVSFANAHSLHIGMAVRILCLVPTEEKWSDLAHMVRYRVRRPLLAWRGLGSSVVTPRKGGGIVNLPHQNEIAARRLFQLYVPGLANISRDAFAFEREFMLDAEESKQGWLYL